MNVNKTCAQCSQVVYPLEQLKCLDQVWHRRCFRCETCGMTLNMGNYRGFEKKPYCSAHYPQPKRFTLVADTPEFKRVAQNTRLFSSVNYNQRRGTNGSLDRHPIPGQLRSVSTIEPSSHSTEFVVPQQQHQQSKTPQLYGTGQPLQSNGIHHENGNGRQLYSSCSASPGHTGLPNNHHVSSANTQSPVHNVADLSSHSLGHERGAGQMVGTPMVAPVNPSSKFRAMYDYQAKEDDEVSFLEGDVILHGDPITEGWMYGTVQRTGQFGMLPSNYVEPID